MRWQMNEIGKAGVYGASLTAEPISFEALVGADPTVQKIDVIVSAVTVAAAVTVSLQEFNGSAWVIVGSALPVAAAGVFTFSIHPLAVAATVLRERIRIVTTTGAGDSVTIADVRQYRVEG